MSEEPPAEPRETAVEQLEAFGLSAYAARTFVALVSLGEGTAQDVSEVSEVPRTRVYDAVEELGDRGLVDVEQTTPKRFWTVSAETAGRHFEREYVSRVHALQGALDALEPVTRSAEQRGVWTVTGRSTVTERVREFVADAEEEVVYMTVGDLLTDEVVEALREASERGATIRLGGMSPEVESALAEAVPEAEAFESIWVWSDTPTGRLLMVDERQTLASVLLEGEAGDAPEGKDETAIWGAGERNSLVAVLKALFTWQLDGNRR